MAKTPPPAFDLRESALKGRWSTYADLAAWIAEELDMAASARSGRRQEMEYCWGYYEQQRMRGTSAPWPDAADLPSPFAAEYTDALQARLMQTIFVEPVWTVEGWGASAAKAPFVEEFHQRAQEDERLQSYADEWILRGLVEGVGTLKVTESVEYQRTRVRKRVKLQLDPVTQQPVMGEQGPLLEQDDAGQFVESADEATPSAEAEWDERQPVRLGPGYEVVPYLDFYVLPAHARNPTQIWGYASRFWRRPPALTAAVGRGMYDTRAVERITETDDRGTVVDDLPRLGVTVVDQQRNTSQKELFECQLLVDLDGQGERWWILTLHKETRTLLRMKIDDGMTHFVRWMPFPKPGTMDHGYSLIGHKLIAVIEEDTARRNMKADRMALKVGQPILRRQGALWDPMEQPFGPRAVIDVRDYDEVRPMQGIEDVPASVMAWASEIRSDADRLVGQNDTSLGVDTQEQRTLGEVQLRAGYAEVRITLIVKRMQEALEMLAIARHAIWKRALAAHPTLPPQRAMVLDRDRGATVDGFPPEGRVTADLLEGTYWFKPRGSVDTADLNRQKAQLNGLLQALGPLMQINPAIRALLSTMPAGKALVEQVLRVYQWPDRQSFLGPEGSGIFEQMAQQQAQQQMEQQLLADPRMRVVMALAGGRAGGGGVAPGAGPSGPPPVQDGVPAA